MHSSGKCKLPSTPPSTGLSKIQHLMMIIANFDFLKHPQMYSYGGNQSSMWHQKPFHEKRRMTPKWKKVVWTFLINFRFLFTLYFYTVTSHISLNTLITSVSLHVFIFVLSCKKREYFCLFTTVIYCFNYRKATDSLHLTISWHQIIP